MQFLADQIITQCLL